MGGGLYRLPFCSPPRASGAVSSVCLKLRDHASERFKLLSDGAKRRSRSQTSHPRLIFHPQDRRLAVADRFFQPAEGTIRIAEQAIDQTDPRRASRRAPGRFSKSASTRLAAMCRFIPALPVAVLPKVVTTAHHTPARNPLFASMVAYCIPSAFRESYRVLCRIKGPVPFP